MGDLPYGMVPPTATSDFGRGLFWFLRDGLNRRCYPVSARLSLPAQVFGLAETYRTQFVVSVVEQVLSFRAFEVPQCFDNVFFNAVNGVVMTAMCAAERFGNDRVNQSELMQVLAGQS